MKTYIVRVHFAVRAKSRALARKRVMEAVAEQVDIRELTWACIDNENEIRAQHQVEKEG